jgi:DNA primase
VRIPPDVIQQIQLHADIVEVVGDYVTLKKQGSAANLWACCPFHNEKTPSFSVAPAKGIYKCFGCGKAGDSIKFVMEVEGVSYPEALRHLAKKYNIEIPEAAPDPEEIQRQSQIDSLYIVLNFAKEFYQKNLLDTEEGRSIGVSYFKERGFRENTIKTFDLGYSLASWDALTKAALAKGYQPDILEKAGLLIRKEGGRQYDRFRERVIFPIHNLSGRVIAFGARILKADKTQPKYLNSPETEVYHKSRVLYGIYQAKNAIRQEDNCCLVEGYTDVISLHQAGIANVVASSGTSLTTEQIRLISRFTKNITVLYDGDPAGIKAALRGVDMVLEEGLAVKVVVFPDSEDPDSYVQKVGPVAFREYILKTGTDFITFKTKLFLAEAANDPFKRAGVIKEIVQSIAKIPDSIQRAVFYKQTANLLEVDEGTLLAEGNKLLLKDRAAGEKAAEKAGEKKQFARDRAPAPPKAKDPSRDSYPSQPPPDPYAPPPADDYYLPPPDDYYLPPDYGSLPDILPGDVSLPQPDYADPGALPAETEPHKASLVYQEEESIRLLLTYAEHVLEGTSDTLSEYILREVEELEFSTPLYNRIITIFREQLQRGHVIGGDFFLRHEDPEIQQAAIHLVTDRYRISVEWKEKFEIYIPHESENLLDVAYSNVLRLKQRVVQEKIRHNMKALSAATATEEQDFLLGGIMQLKQIEKQIAGILGNVIRSR